jgi:polyhydroxyalkanoate synthesis regulator phasin
LVVFYVNRAAEAQTRFNTSVVRVLNGIVSGIDADQTPERVERLERRVAALEKQLKALASSPTAADKQENP